MDGLDLGILATDRRAGRRTEVMELWLPVTPAATATARRRGFEVAVVVTSPLGEPDP